MSQRGIVLLLVAVGCAAPAARGPAGAPDAPAAAAAVDPAELMHDIGVLAHDSMEGRLVGSAGNARARRFLEQRFSEIGLRAAGGGGFRQEFEAVAAGSPVTGVNLIGVVQGTSLPDRYIVVTAHYDHIGVRDGEIYNGADDNASGTAALLQLAEHFTRNRPRHSILFAALDAEEGGLRGARAFVDRPPVPLQRIVLNVNMDMVGRNDANELYVAGTHHYPHLLPWVQRVAAGAEVALIPGHDTPNAARPSDDWTNASDHGPFHEAGIPFLYFGVEDHPAYHHPSDDVSGIQPAFFARAVGTVLAVVRLLDAELATPGS